MLARTGNHRKGKGRKVRDETHSGVQQHVDQISEPEREKTELNDCNLNIYVYRARRAVYNSK